MPLGAEDGRLVPGSFSSSSYYNHHLAPWHGRLNHRWSWSVRHRRHGEWLQVSFGSSSTCKGVATQGRQDANQWVTRYTLSYSKDGMRFYPYNEGRGTVVMKKCLHILMGYWPCLSCQDMYIVLVVWRVAYVYELCCTLFSVFVNLVKHGLSYLVNYLQLRASNYVFFNFSYIKFSMDFFSFILRCSEGIWIDLESFFTASTDHL